MTRRIRPARPRLTVGEPERGAIRYTMTRVTTTTWEGDDFIDALEATGAGWIRNALGPRDEVARAVAEVLGRPHSGLDTV